MIDPVLIARWAASPHTSAQKRDLLKAAMEDCPACMPEDADYVDDDQLDSWLASHGVEPEVQT